MTSPSNNEGLGGCFVGIMLAFLAVLAFSAVFEKIADIDKRVGRLENQATQVNQ